MTMKTKQLDLAIRNVSVAKEAGFNVVARAADQLW